MLQTMCNVLSLQCEDRAAAWTGPSVRVCTKFLMSWCHHVKCDSTML